MHAADAPSHNGLLERCARWIASEPELALALGTLVSPDDFRDALIALIGTRVGADDAAMLVAQRFDRPARHGLSLGAWPLSQRRGWQPFALEWGAHGAELVWGIAPVRDDLPFHEQVTADLRHRPLNRWFAMRTPLTPEFVDALEADMLPLSGLILHMSRCGSTLIAQSLKAWPGTRVISEPGILDIALTAALAGMDPQWLSFRGVLAALRQPAGEDRDVVIKLDAWHALALAPLQAQLPGVPWLFAYRDPLEVLASHAKEPGRHTVPGMLPEAWLGEPLRDGEQLAPVHYAARVLGVICAAVRAHARPSNLVNYAELVERDSPVLARSIPHHFGLDPAHVDAERFATTLTRHAKRPLELFADDSASKRAAITDELRAAAARWITPHYDALEAIRSAR